MRKIEGMIRSILQKSKNARNNDWVLYLEVAKKCHKEVLDFPFAYVLKEGAENLGLPPYESVTRVRRKLQAECPELRATETIRERRKHLRDKYKAYALK